ncbi:MAG: queuosine salvage family protein [Patescibacteria group bacterium]|nr:queuosine salvage family protein [Patescibacteria group bacterium]
MIKKVLPSTKYVLENFQHVSIIPPNISKLAADVKRSDLAVSEIRLVKYEWPLEKLLELTFLFNTLNYCFFAMKGKEKWTIADDKLDGAIALFRALENEARRDQDIFEGKYLSKLKLEDFREILKGNVEISLLHERLKCLNEAGHVLVKKFEGRFINLFDESKFDAVRMAELLIDSFRNFRDVSLYKGKQVYFFKRAQLNSKMVNDILISNGKQPLKNLDKLSAFADYKIPQILRSLGILKYSKTLAEKIDNFQLMKANSEEEVEIRAATIWAVEYIRRGLTSSFPNVTASYIDGMLWNLAQRLDRDKLPYHRTYTVAY